MTIMLRKISLLLLTILIVTITGCSEEYLDTRPTDAISSADALSSPENMNLVIQGLHRQMYAQSPLPGGSNSRAGEHYFIPLGDVACGDLIHSARGNGWQRAELQWLTHINETSLTIDQLWYQRYHVIASSNAIINKGTGMINR